MVEDQFAHGIKCEQGKGDEQDYFFIGQLFREHSDVFIGSDERIDHWIFLSVFLIRTVVHINLPIIYAMLIYLLIFFIFSKKSIKKLGID